MARAPGSAVRAVVIHTNRQGSKTGEGRARQRTPTGWRPSRTITPPCVSLSAERLIVWITMALKRRERGAAHDWSPLRLRSPYSRQARHGADFFAWGPPPAADVRRPATGRPARCGEPPSAVPCPGRKAKPPRSPSQPCRSPPSRIRQDDGSVGGDGDGMLKMGRKTAVFRHRGPAVAQNFHLIGAGVDHRLNG